MFAKRLVSLRKAAKLTQQQLADQLGITRGTLSMYEIGKREPDFATTQKIADFFDVSIDWLLGKDDVSTGSKQTIESFVFRVNLQREKLGISIPDFAKLIGLQPSTIEKWDNSLAKLPGQQTLDKCAEVLGVTRDYLLGYTDDPKGYGTKSYSTDKPDLKELLENQPLRYDGVELSPEEQEIITAHVRMAYDLIKKSNKIRAGQRRKNTPSEE
jgi:transcriptional regulator with XRE-family HTH domain